MQPSRARVESDRVPRPHEFRELPLESLGLWPGRQPARPQSVHDLCDLFLADRRQVEGDLAVHLGDVSSTLVTGSCASPTSGSLICRSAPPASLDTRDAVPPCRLTMPRRMDRPSPMCGLPFVET